MRVRIAGNVGRAVLATALVVAAGVAATVAFGSFDRSSAAGEAARRSTRLAPDTSRVPAVQVQGYQGKCLTASAPTDGAGVVLETCGSRMETPAQVWFFMLDGTAQLANTTLCLDVAWASKANKAKIQVAECTAGPGQRFRFEPAGDLVNVNANRCVDVAGWGRTDGTPLIQWDCHGGANQKWERVLGARRLARTQG